MKHGEASTACAAGVFDVRCSCERYRRLSIGSNRMGDVFVCGLLAEPFATAPNNVRSSKARPKE